MAQKCLSAIIFKSLVFDKNGKNSEQGFKVYRITDKIK